MNMSPILFEALETAVTVAAASGIVAGFASVLKRIVRDREHTVSVKLRDGKEVRLELDNRLSPDKASELIRAAIASANSGDDAALKQTIDASHAASQKARATAK